eukprot:TRINITY_DN271_c2_g1_i3.p1 TRINITY_DN271_c2_g1~~TRINITY_DN271_c2_g1_i3.p1  ORF type:complete len:104 (-),score=3.35 TRINITY_DN271_c2_g1_i3:471-782(-)
MWHSTRGTTSIHSCDKHHTCDKLHSSKAPMISPQVSLRLTTRVPANDSPENLSLLRYVSQILDVSLSLSFFLLLLGPNTAGHHSLTYSQTSALEDKASSDKRK